MGSTGWADGLSEPGCALILAATAGNCGALCIRADAGSDGVPVNEWLRVRFIRDSLHPVDGLTGAFVRGASPNQ